MHSIVIGYHGSEPAGRGLERAAQLADADAAVAVVSVTYLLVGKGGMTHDPAEQGAHKRHLREAKARLEELGVQASTVESFGDPAEAIVGVAARARADLIVVGHEHKGLVERLLRGSVSAGVTRRAECDVLVVN